MVIIIVRLKFIQVCVDFRCFCVEVILWIGNWILNVELCMYLYEIASWIKFLSCLDQLNPAGEEVNVLSLLINFLSAMGWLYFRAFFIVCAFTFFNRQYN